MNRAVEIALALVIVGLIAALIVYGSTDEPPNCEGMGCLK